jgi:hypothetical protein
LFACVQETIEHDDAAAEEEDLIDGFVSVFLRERIEENAEEEEALDCLEIVVSIGNGEQQDADAAASAVGASEAESSKRRRFVCIVKSAGLFLALYGWR